MKGQLSRQREDDTISPMSRIFTSVLEGVYPSFLLHKRFDHLLYHLRVEKISHLNVNVVFR